MPENRDAGVDPRFDPVFQRGYDPKRHGARRARPAQAPEPRAQSALVPRAHSTPATAPPPPTARTGHTPEPDLSAQQPTAPAVASTDDEFLPPPRNPFRLILLLASLLAIGGAAILLWRRIDEDPYGGYGGYGGDVGQVFVQQFEDALLAPLITGGLLGLCLWLALGAIRRQDHG